MTDDTTPSDKPLIEKLGFMPGETIFVETTPAWYSQMVDEAGVEITPDLPASHAHLFFNSKEELLEFLDEYNINQVEKSLWFSWPKKTSGTKTDLTEQTFRDLVLPLKWVDTKVIAVDDTWSGLKFLRRKKA